MGNFQLQRGAPRGNIKFIHWDSVEVYPLHRSNAFLRSQSWNASHKGNLATKKRRDSLKIGFLGHCNVTPVAVPRFRNLIFVPR